MFSKLILAFALFTSSAFGQAAIQGGAAIKNGATLNVVAQAPIGVTVTPPNASVAVGNTQNFVATLTNDLGNAGVIWTVSGTSCTLATDSFGGANSNPIGSPWVNLSGAPAQLLNHQFTGIPGAVGGSGATFDGSVAWSHDQFSQATLVAFPNNNGFAGLELDRGATESYQLGITTIGTPGGFSQPSTVLFIRAGITLASFHIVPQPNDILTAGIVGQVLSFFQNGTLIGSFTDPGSVIATGRPGLDASINSGLAGAVAWDNWSGGTNSTGCGFISPNFSRSGQAVTYTAPATVPPNSAITITATSVQDPTRFGTATINLTSTAPPSPTVLTFKTNTTKQAGAAANTFPAPNMVGDTPIVGITALNGANITSVVDNLGRSFTDVGCQQDTPLTGHVAMFYLLGNTQTITSVTVNSTGAVGGNIDVGYIDSNTGSSVQPDVAAVCTGSTTPTTNPLGPTITTATTGDLVVSLIAVGSDSFNVAAPFVFGALDRGDGMGYAIGVPIATYTPSWNTDNFAWGGISAAFRVGAQPNLISVTQTPTTASVQTNGKQNFTVNIVNDNTHAGATIALSGAGCAGPTCGSITGTTLNKTTNLTGVTATTSMVLTLAQPTTGNLLILPAFGSNSNSVYTSAGDDKGNIWNVTPTAKDTGNGADAIFWTIGTPGVTKITVNQTNPTGFANFYLYDVSISPTTVTVLNAKQDNGGSTTNPVGPTVTPTGAGIAVAVIVPAAGNPSAIAAPFTQTGANAFTAYDLNAGAGALTPSWTTGAGTWTSTILSIMPVTTVQSGQSYTYTAPNAVPSPAQVSATATSVADGSKHATSTITVTGTPVVGVTNSPSNQTLTAGGNSNITATVTNDPPNKGVTWFIGSSNCSGAACGTISANSSPSGTAITYFAPATVNTPLSITLTSTSVSDSTKTAVTTITVNQAIQPPANCNPNCPAFPEAQGGGAATPGGRGGAVFEVTNLNDSGSGSLRNCVQASGPRTCVFRVAGTIPLSSRLTATNPFLTIAGQTAPGDGITMGGPTGFNECLFISTHDVVVRYLNYSGDNPSFATGPRDGTGCFEIASSPNIFNVVLDHISSRWYGNKSFSFVNNNGPTEGIRNVTYQWLLVYEPICTASSCHPVGSLGTDSTTGSALLVNEIDFHHNMIINVDHRSPLAQSANRTRWVNNISYVFNQFAGLNMGGLHVDYIGNKWVDGGLSDSTHSLPLDSVHPILGERGDNPADLSDNCQNGPCDNPGPPSWYLLNNIGRSTPTPFSTPIPATNVVNDNGQKSLTAQGTESGDSGSATPSSWFRSTPNPTEAFPIIPDQVTNLDAIIPPLVGNSRRLDCSGNWVTNRNSQDARVIQQYQNRTAGTLYHFQIADPVIAPGAACTSSLHDGIPDAWKQRYGLSTLDAGLGSRIDTNTGFTYLEDYLDGIVP